MSYVNFNCSTIACQKQILYMVFFKALCNFRAFTLGNSFASHLSPLDTVVFKDKLYDTLKFQQSEICPLTTKTNGLKSLSVIYQNTCTSNVYCKLMILSKYAINKLLIMTNFQKFN